MLGRFAGTKANGPLRAVCLLAASAAARAVPAFATWREDRPPGPYFWSLLESSAKLSSLFNRSINRCTTASAEAGF